MNDTQPTSTSGWRRTAVWGLGLAAFLLSRKLFRAATRTNLNGKVALVTGGSRGLGLAIANELGSKGARLVLCARNSGQLLKAKEMLTAEGYDVLTVQADLTQPEEVGRMMERITSHFGGIDIVVNNAGQMIVGPENVMDADDYKKIMDVNLWSALYVIEAAMPHFRRQQEGHIVNICSIGGKIAVPHMLPYSVSKFALVGLSQGLTSELAGENIKVTTVVPNLMRTGSPRNITVKGDHEAEYAWFKIADSLPFLSQSAGSAARRIVEGIQAGDTQVTLTLTARLAVAAQAIAPSIVASAMKIAGMLLPESEDRSAKKGHESESELTGGAVTQVTDQAAARYNQH